MGGLDIFKARKNDEGQWLVENMRYPVNSTADDFGIIFEKDREAGFFSSRRKGRGARRHLHVLPPPINFNLLVRLQTQKRKAQLPRNR
jgi:peptidoglycan-associated lipoprotein